jgi:hypothetical protein
MIVARLLLGAVAVEAVGAQRRPHADMRAHRRTQRAGGDGDCGFSAQGCGGGPAGFLGRERRHGVGLAEAQHQHPRQAGAGGEDGDGLALAAGEFRHVQRARDGAAGGLVRKLPHARRRLAFRNQQHQGPRFRQGRFGEGDVEHARRLPGNPGELPAKTFDHSSGRRLCHARPARLHAVR